MTSTQQKMLQNHTRYTHIHTSYQNNDSYNELNSYDCGSSGSNVTVDRTVLVTVVDCDTDVCKTERPWQTHYITTLVSVLADSAKIASQSLQHCLGPPSV